jgi:hypothetical protein
MKFGVEMNTYISRIVSMSLFFIFIFLSGYWLSRSGKPYPMIIFTLHKLISLGALIFLSAMVYKIYQTTPLPTVQVIVIVVTGICFLIMMITGGLLSIEKSMPAVIHKTHQITPYLTLISVSLTLYLLLLQSSHFTPAAS